MKYYLAIVILTTQLPADTFFASRVSIGSVPISMLELFLLPILPWIVLTALFSGEIRSLVLSPPLGLPLLLYAACCLLSASWGLFNGNPLYLVVQEIRYPIYLIVVYAGMLISFKEPGIAKSYVAIMLVGAIGALAYSLAFQLGRLGGATSFAEVKEIGLPITIVREALVWLVVLYAIAGWRINRLALILFVGGGITVLLLSFIRTLWLAFILLLLVLGAMLITSPKEHRGDVQRRISRLVSSTGLLSLLVLPFALPMMIHGGLIDRLAALVGQRSELNELDPSYVKRKSDVVLALNDALEDPVFGKGLGYESAERYSYISAAALGVTSYRGVTDLNTRSGYLENCYLYVFLKMGIAGSAIFVYLLFMAFKSSFVLSKRGVTPLFRAAGLALFVNLITTAFLANFWQIFDYFELAPWVAMDFALIEMFWLLNEYESRLRIADEQCDLADIDAMKMPNHAWVAL